MDEKMFETIKVHLEEEYLLIRKGKFWSLIGGFLGALAAIGLISFGAAKSALESSTARNTLNEIQALKAQADSYTAEIEALRDSNKEKIDLIETYYNKTDNLALAIQKVDQEIDDRVKYNSDIEIHNSKLPHLVMDVRWPRDDTPKDGTILQVYTDLSNDAQKWQIKKN